MRSAPPALATWLLERSSVDEALTGDLVEEFVGGRGEVWYWKQTLAAMLVSLGRELVAHKWLALRAIATGWIVWMTLQYLVQPRFEQWTEPGVVPVAPFKYLSWVGIGWIIGRFHRPYQTSMVLAYVVFALLMSLPWIYTFLNQTIGHPSYTTTPSGVALALASLMIGGFLSAPRTRKPRMGPS
jgi:hypothetical protein